MYNPIAGSDNISRVGYLNVCIFFQYAVNSFSYDFYVPLYRSFCLDIILIFQKVEWFVFEKGIKPLNFNPDKFFKHAIGITSSEDEPSLIIFKADNVSAKYIESQPFHSSQKTIKEGKNKTTFELKVLISEEFIRSLISFGGGIEIIEPLELREEIIFRLKEMMKNYKIS